MSHRRTRRRRRDDLIAPRADDGES